MKRKKSKYKRIKSIDEVLDLLMIGVRLYWISSLEKDSKELEARIENFSDEYCWVQNPDNDLMPLQKEYHTAAWSISASIEWHDLRWGYWFVKKGEEG